MTDSEDQSDEILAVSEILPQGTFKYECLEGDGAGYSGSIEVNVDLSVPMCVLESETTKFTVTYLPPILLEFTLPTNYPSSASPIYKLSCAWLTISQVQILNKNLDQLAQENVGGVVLFLWINLLQEESLTILNIENEIDLRVIKADRIKSGSDIKRKKSTKQLNPAIKEFIPQQKTSKHEQKDKEGLQQKNFKQEKNDEEKTIKNSKRLHKGRETRFNGKVKSWNLEHGTGIIHSLQLGELQASKLDITAPNLCRLEVSLNVGEVVQFETSKVKASNKLRAVNITAPEATSVQGSKSSEFVEKMLHQNVIGHVESWNDRRMEGSIKLQDLEDSVYVYFTSLHFNVKRIKEKNLKLILNVVTCKQYGRLAQYVRIFDESVPTLSCSPSVSSSSASVSSPSEALATPTSSSVMKATTSDSEQTTICDNTKTEENEEDTTNQIEQLTDDLTNCDMNENGTVNADSQEDAVIKVLAARLKEYNTMKEEKMFGVTMFDCQVCFCEKSGYNSIKFAACGHIFCKECMSGYFTVQIQSGQVKNLTCPQEKCNSQALPSQVEELVETKLYSKYERLLLDTTLQSMADVISCPRVYCQCPTVIDRENNLGQCPSCFFSFCIYCLATYHGVSSCKIKTKEHKEICNKYTEGNEEDRRFLEKRYGKAKLQQLMDNVKTEQYITDNAVVCPHCSAPIEKNDGCNKMTCWRCHTNFCWLCGDKLPAQNPYSHFNIMGNQCYGALFQGVDPELDDGWEQDFFL